MDDFIGYRYKQYNIKIKFISINRNQIHKYINKIFLENSKCFL